MNDVLLSDVPTMPRPRSYAEHVEDLADTFTHRKPTLAPMPRNDGNGGPPPMLTEQGCAEPPNDRHGAMTTSEYEMAEFYPGRVDGRAATIHVAHRNASRLIEALGGAVTPLPQPTPEATLDEAGEDFPIRDQLTSALWAGFVFVAGLAAVVVIGTTLGLGG